jgi:hypothetical protein
MSPELSILVFAVVIGACYYGIYKIVQWTDGVRNQIAEVKRQQVYRLLREVKQAQLEAKARKGTCFLLCHSLKQNMYIMANGELVPPDEEEVFSIIEGNTLVTPEFGLMHQEGGKFEAVHRAKPSIALLAGDCLFVGLRSEWKQLAKSFGIESQPHWKDDRMFAWVKEVQN